MSEDGASYGLFGGTGHLPHLSQLWWVHIGQVTPYGQLQARSMEKAKMMLSEVEFKGDDLMKIILWKNIWYLVFEIVFIIIIVLVLTNSVNY